MKRPEMPLKPFQVYGYFRTASCGPIQNWWTQPKSGEARSFTIPANAKWLILQPVTTLPTKDISVTSTSPGRKCQ